MFVLVVKCCVLVKNHYYKSDDKNFQDETVIQVNNAKDRKSTFVDIIVEFLITFTLK